MHSLKKQKQMRYILLTLTLVLFLILGCRKQVLDFEYADFEAEPTLNAILVEGQPIRVHVSLAQRLDSIHASVCQDADVFLYEDDTLIEKLHYEDGFYIGETIAKAHHNYGCKVSLPDFDTLFAQTEVPDKPVVTNIGIMENATIDEDGRPCPAILLTFNTDPEQHLYYTSNIDAGFINYHVIDGDTTGFSTETGNINHSINVDDPVLLNEGSGNLVFSNDIITTNTYTLKINSSFSGHGWGGSHFGGVITRSGYLVVRMHGISESCFQYLKSKNSIEELDGYENPFIGTIIPANPYGNVENGRGVFGAVAPMTMDTVFFP